MILMSIVHLNLMMTLRLFLGRTLEFIKLVQEKRDNNRSQTVPTGDGPSRHRRKPTEKKIPAFTK